MRLLWMLGLSGCVFITEADQEQWEQKFQDDDDDGFVRSEDCDDDDASIHPGATERCDDVDQDCDELVDEDASDALTLHADSDGDGFGDAEQTTAACAASSGWVLDDSDCDDSDAAVNPESTWYVDADADGYGDDAFFEVACEPSTSTRVLEGGDCDDDAEEVNPGATESCNERDDDCDDAVDETIGEVDSDGDGYGQCVDCDDEDPDRHPGLFDWVDGVDNDCDEVIDITSMESADAWMEGSLAFELLGYAVAGVGDIDGDGRADVLVGSRDAYDDDRGAAMLWLGGDDTGLSTPWVTFDGPNANAAAGRVLDMAGDVDNDGIVDFIVGADGLDDDGSGPGGAYLIYGDELSFEAGDEGDEINLSKYLELRGETAGDRAGRSVCGLGDIDGDRKDDLFVGATQVEALDGTKKAGIGYLITTEPVADLDLATEADGVIRGVAFKDRVGRSCARAGDIDGDGIDDIVLPSPYVDGEVGAVHLFLGVTTGLGDVTLGDADGRLTNSTSLKVGWSVDARNDLDGDGYLDLLVGAPSGNDGAGLAWMLYGPLTSADLQAPDATYNGEFDEDFAGNKVRVVGDLDGDGADEIAIAARGSDRAEDGAGIVYLMRGVTTGTFELGEDADAFLEGGAAVDDGQTGFALDGVGDFDGDGFDDLVIGSPGALEVGRAELVRGGE